MVVGGSNENGLLNDVELISETNTEECSKSVSPMKGKVFENSRKYFSGNSHAIQSVSENLNQFTNLKFRIRNFINNHYKPFKGISSAASLFVPFIFQL